MRSSNSSELHCTSQTVSRLILLFNPDQPPISLRIFNDLPEAATVNYTAIQSSELLFVSMNTIINSSCH